jgi:hypothetical protein
MQAIDKINEIYTFKPNYVIEAIRIALNDDIACCEDSENNITTFVFLYKDGSQLTIDTMGHCKVLNTGYEYWVY